MPRTSVELSVQVGQDGTLDDCLFKRDLSQVNDALARATSGLYELSPGELNVAVDFGDVSTARLIYVESTEPIEVSLGGVLGTVGTLLGSGGTFPTGFVGGEAFSFTIDGTSVAGTFTVTAQTAQQCVNELNAAAMLVGLGFVPFVVEGGQIRVSGNLATSAGDVTVATANATLGFATTVSVPGTDPITGADPLQVAAPTSGADTLKGYLLATVETTSVILSNAGSALAQVRVLIAGDLVS